MKWFKHHSDAYSNLKLRTVINRHGMKGYGVFWVVNELVAQQGTGQLIPKSKCWLEELTYQCRETPEEIQTILRTLAEIESIDAEALARGDLYIPKLSEYGDEYSGRKKSVGTLSGHYRDVVGLEENRRDKNRREEKPHARLEWLTQIPTQDLTELCEKYEASTSQVKRKAEELSNYCKAKGKLYKNYRAFLENALMRDFGRRRVVEKPRIEEPKPLSETALKAMEEIRATMGRVGKEKRVV